MYSGSHSLTKRPNSASNVLRGSAPLVLLFWRENGWQGAQPANSNGFFLLPIIALRADGFIVLRSPSITVAAGKFCL